MINVFSYQRQQKSSKTSKWWLEAVNSGGTVNIMAKEGQNNKH